MRTRAQPIAAGDLPCTAGGEGKPGKSDKINQEENKNKKEKPERSKKYLPVRNEIAQVVRISAKTRESQKFHIHLEA